MLNSTKFGARACCGVAQLTAASRRHSQKFFGSSPRLMAAGDDWDGGWSSSATRVIFDGEPGDSDTSADGSSGGRRRAAGSAADAAEQSPRHKILFERSNNIEALGLARYTHFTLPGDATMVEQYKKLIVPVHRPTFSALDDLKRSPDLTRDQQRQQIEAVRQFDAVNRHSKQKIKQSDDQGAKRFKFVDNVRCTAHECPVLVKRDFVDSFPDVNLRGERNFTILAIREKCVTADIFLRDGKEIDGEAHENFASDGFYSPQTSAVPFCEVAEEVCHFLQESGHWADFVDPYSGRLHCTDPPEADDWPTSHNGDLALSRFAGLSVERCGTCTVVSMPSRRPMSSDESPALASNVGGVVFTSAPIKSAAMKVLLESTSLTSPAPPPPLSTDSAPSSPAASMTPSTDSRQVPVADVAKIL